MDRSLIWRDPAAPDNSGKVARVALVWCGDGEDADELPHCSLCGSFEIANFCANCGARIDWRVNAENAAEVASCGALQPLAKPPATPGELLWEQAMADAARKIGSAPAVTADDAAGALCQNCDKTTAEIVSETMREISRLAGNTHWLQLGA